MNRSVCLHDIVITSHRSTISVLFSTSSNGHIGLGVSHGEVVEGHIICIVSIGWGMQMLSSGSRICERGVRDGGDRGRDHRPYGDIFRRCSG